MNIKGLIHNHKSVVESFFSLSVLNMIEAFLPLITLPYILRIVGAANYGIYSFIMIIIQYLQIFNVYGFNFSATKQVSLYRDDAEKINNIYSSVIVCRLILFVVGVAIVLLTSFWLFDNNTQLIMFLMGIGIIFGDVLNPVWLFQGKEKMRYMTIVNSSTKIFFTLLIFIFIREASDYIYIILYQSLGYLISGILSTIIARKIFKIRLRLPSWRDIAYQFREGFAVFTSTIGINLYRNANIFILKFFVSDAALGIYSAAEKIIKGMQMLTNPIAQALFPHMSHSFKQHSYEENISNLRRMAYGFAAILLVVVVLTNVFAKWLVLLLCGSEFMDAVLIVRLMSPVILFGGLNYILGITGLINLDYSKYFVYSVFIAGVASVVTLLATATHWGINAGALSMVEAEVILLLSICLSFVHISNGRKKLKE